MNQEKPKVYLDTTIFSYLVDERVEITAQVLRTKEWWEEERHDYYLATSQFVLDELHKSHFPNKNRAIEFTKAINILEVTPEIDTIIGVYVQQFLMPQDTQGDAAHLAMASFHGIDYLLTWNCKHLANIKKKRHIELINKQLGLFIPDLLTPDILRIVEG